MADIKLSPELLMSQSTELASMKNDFDGLFTQVTGVLNGMNESWSENLARNFAGKITGAQKSFSSVLNMLTNSSQAARISSLAFSSGNAGNILSHMLGTGNTEIMKDGMSKLADWLSGKELDKAAAAWISEQLGMGADAETIKNAVSQIMDGDFEGALKTAGEKGIDLLAKSLSGSIEAGSWVDQLNQATGGKLGLEGLENAYYKNLIGSTLGNAADIVKEQLSGNPDRGQELRTLGELAWNATAGSVIETGFDQAYNVVSKIPIIGDYYANQGATDGESAIGVMCGDLMYAMTGNNDDAAYARNYYSDHGGIAGGIVDGVKEVAGFAGEKLGDVFSFDYHSIFR